MIEETLLTSYNVIFSSAACIYLIKRFEKILENNTNAINNMSNIINKCKRKQ